MNRAEILNQTSKFLNHFHVKQPLYNTAIALAQQRALKQVEKIKKTEPQKIENPKKIIFHCLHGSFLPAIYKETAIAKTLQLKGHDVKMLLCGGVLPCCSGLFTEDNPESEYTCLNCFNFSRKFFELVGLPYIYYDSYVSVEDLEETIDCNNNVAVHKGVDVYSHSLSSLFRYYKGKIPKNPYIKFLKHGTAIVAVEVAESILENEKPDVIVTSHSCYSEWGSFADYFRNKGIPVYTWYTGGYDPNTLTFDLDKISQNFDRYKNLKNMTDQIFYDVCSFMKTREKGSGDTAQYGYKTGTDLGIDRSGYKKVYGMFPNMPWDVDPTCQTLYGSIYTWVLSTIELFKEHPDRLLIIKIHPAEKLYKSLKTVQDVINEYHPTLPKNVIVLPPDTLISPYDLFKILDVGLVSNSTVGLELLFHQIPIITVGGAHYKGKGFTNDANTREEYKNLLFADKLELSNRDIFWEYCYFYFIKSFIPFTVFKRKSFLNMSYTIKSFKEFVEDKYLSHIADCIVGDGFFQNY